MHCGKRSAAGAVGCGLRFMAVFSGAEEEAGSLGAWDDFLDYFRKIALALLLI